MSDVILTEQSAPASPGATKHAVYVDGTTKKLASKDSAGSVVDYMALIAPSTAGNVLTSGGSAWTSSALTGERGYMRNGVITPSVSSNNLTVALKTLAGSDPSATNPVIIRIGNVDRIITSALSVTKNAGTNWYNSGGAELATKEIDYFVYIGYNATDGITIGFSRIPYADIYGDFSATTTNETYCAISTITSAAAGDNYENIGRFAATLSAGAGYTWSVPTYDATNLIQRPIYETRWLIWTIVYTGFTATTPTSSNTYKVWGDICFIHRDVLTNGTSNATTLTLSFPFMFNDPAAIITWTASLDNNALQATPGQLQIASGGSNIANAYKTFYQGAWTNLGNKNIYLLDFTYKLR